MGIRGEHGASSVVPPHLTLCVTDSVQLDPVGQNTLLSNDNYFYQLCLQGKYSRKYVQSCPSRPCLTRYADVILATWA